MMTQIIVLAGGKGTRMRSDHPKVLTLVKGVPMIRRVLEAVTPLCSRPAIVVGYKGEEVVQTAGDEYSYIWQKEQLGTGHAVSEARAEFADMPNEAIIVIPGDHPLISEKTVRDLIDYHRKGKAVITLATVNVPNFEGDFKLFERFGRIIRDEKGMVARDVEFKDATDKEKRITEVNCGYYCFEPAWLWEHIEKLENENAAKEYYLTDLIGLARRDGKTVRAMIVNNPQEGMGVNTPEELAIAEKYAE